jgi:hypothetical protein
MILLRIPTKMVLDLLFAGFVPRELVRSSQGEPESRVDLRIIEEDRYKNATNQHLRLGCSRVQVADPYTRQRD